ncbi:hypothetical protein ABT330_09795 [Streptomyces sp. NPDC000658]|uniref:hypothetical protein n=1 Tax=Streptomyces sp. NPDC000658 TaxID=3154266 RepID=UPI00332525E5
MAPPPTARVTAVDTHDIRAPARRESLARYTPHPGGGSRAADRDSRKEKTA